MIQDEALYVAVIMNYADDIEGLLMNGAKSTFCDYVSSSCYLKSQMSLSESTVVLSM